MMNEQDFSVRVESDGEQLPDLYQVLWRYYFSYLKDAEKASEKAEAHKKALLEFYGEG